MQKLADETGLTIKVRHYPPGTSKWNKIEHRLFCHITQNWRGRPLTDRAAVVELIAATTTKTGLKVESALDTRTYQKGIKVTNAEMKSLDIRGDKFHPEWNYTVIPRTPKFEAVMIAAVLKIGPMAFCICRKDLSCRSARSKRPSRRTPPCDFPTDFVQASLP